MTTAPFDAWLEQPISFTPKKVEEPKELQVYTLSYDSDFHARPHGRHAVQNMDKMTPSEAMRSGFKPCNICFFSVDFGG